MIAARGAFERFRRDRVALGAFWMLVVWCGLGVLAPLLASSRPFYLHVPPEASAGFKALPPGWSFPWFSGLFDERVYESGLDLAFNGLLATAPILLLAFVVRSLRRRRLAVLVGWIMLGVATSFVARHGEPVLEYVAKVERLREKGHEIRALFPLLPYAVEAPDVSRTHQSPSAAHPAGTDEAGRDVLTRLLFGLRISLTIGLVAVSIYVAIGVLLGALAGYLRGFADVLIRKLIEVVSCFPSFLLVMTLVAFVPERSIFHVMLIIGLTGWPSVARLVRAEFLAQSEMDYAAAARALGLPRWRIIFRHLLPNCLAPVAVVAAFGVSGAILVESGLAFLDLGDATAASWGQVLRSGRDSGDLHLILGPGLLIFLTVTMMNVVAEGLRDATDPKLSRP